MFANDPDRGPPTALKGWLSDIYFPALLDAQRAPSLDALAQRLGARATVDDPLFGRAAGLPAITARLDEMASWLAKHSASYERLAFTTGIDRDVTEGTLSLTFDAAEKAVDLPVAVVAERRRSREVELRLYFSTQPVRGKFGVRAPLVAAAEPIALPAPVGEYVDALAAGKLDAILATFEHDGFLREPRGVQHAKGDGTLRTYFEKLFAGGAFGGGVEMTRGGAADDGRTCALEYTITKICGRSVPPQAGLLMLERGESALLRAVRVYDDVEM